MFNYSKPNKGGDGNCGCPKTDDVEVSTDKKIAGNTSVYKVKLSDLTDEEAAAIAAANTTAAGSAGSAGSA